MDGGTLMIQNVNTCFIKIIDSHLYLSKNITFLACECHTACDGCIHNWIYSANSKSYFGCTKDIDESNSWTETTQYTLHAEKLTYEEAVDFCLSNGQKLAEPKSVHASDKIAALAKSIKSRVWIGIDDKSSEGDFTYASDGKPIGGFTNWSSRNPDNAGVYGNEDCVVYGNNNGFLWNDYHCSAKNSFVCESVLGGPWCPTEVDKDGIYISGSGNFKKCDANCHISGSSGSKSTVCDKSTGKCDCNDNVVGDKCTQCESGYWGFPSCQSGYRFDML